MDTPLPNIERARIDAIFVPSSHREVDEGIVTRLMQSIGAIGLQHAITVRIVDEYQDAEEGIICNAYVLVAGRHRLEACRRLGHVHIDCVAKKWDEIQARMWEIAENLERSELTAIERAEQISEYARLAEERRASGISAQVAPKSKSDSNPKGAGRPESGDRAAARDLGLTRDQIRRAKAVASITPEAKAAAVEAGIADNQSKLLKVASAPKERQVRTVRDDSAKRSTPSESHGEFKSREQWIGHMMRAWAQAPQAWRDHFMKKVTQ